MADADMMHTDTNTRWLTAMAGLPLCALPNFYKSVLDSLLCPFLCLYVSVCYKDLIVARAARHIALCYYLLPHDCTFTTSVPAGQRFWLRCQPS